MGTATAYALSQVTEKRILQVDRYGIGNDYCSSNDVNRVFRYAYGNDELYTKMAVESLRLWKKLENDTRQELLIPTGLLMLEGEDENSNKFEASSYNILNGLGLGAHIYERPELEQKFPQFRAEKGFFDPHGGVLLASKSLETFASEARKRGVKNLSKHVTTINNKSGLEIETSDGDSIRSKKAIVTIGPWTNRFRRDGLTRMTPTRQQLVYLKPKRSIEKFRPDSCPVFFTDHHYGLPAVGIDAVKISNKELSEPVDPETVKRTVDPEQIEACKAACRKFIPDLADGDVFQSKVCLYDMTENSDFVLDTDPDHPNIVYGYGFSGHGFKFAPLIGQLLAALILDQDPSLDLSRFTINEAERGSRSTGGHLGQGE
jgi:glycine/D-amino acid oxidase-like deaminating enzyme